MTEIYCKKCDTKITENSFLTSEPITENRIEDIYHCISCGNEVKVLKNGKDRILNVEGGYRTFVRNGGD